MNKLTESVVKTLCFSHLKENFVFSPASYQEAIHSLSLCVKDKNLDEILDVLELSKKELVNYIEKYKKNSELENSNFLLHAREYVGSLNKNVIKKLRKLNVEIRSLNFNNSDIIVNEINKIVLEKTHGKIQNLIEENELNNLVKFIILNCVYFKKDWLWEFDKRDYKEKFYGVDGITEINFLNKQERFNYYEDSSLDIVEIPYKNSDICCYLLVPRNGLFEIIDNLKTHYEKIKLVRQDCQVNLTCPSFKIESTFSLEDVTRLAGIKSVFGFNKNWDLVDFSTLKPEAVLAVDKIKQKAYIDFTKKGTEAAAATYISLAAFSGCTISFEKPKIKFIRADKPFLYILANKNNKDNPLFVGLVSQVKDMGNAESIPPIKTLMFKI